MYDSGKVIFGIAIFLCLMFAGTAYNVFSGKRGYKPKLTLPKGECIKGKRWMRENHMKLLNDWRTRWCARASGKW